MKTNKHLWENFNSIENLYTAAMKSQRGKRWKPATLTLGLVVQPKGKVTMAQLPIRKENHIKLTTIY